MLHQLRQRATDEKGFTLIELLVVILIIGILAAIALPAFLGQKGRAQDTEAKTIARTAQTAMETFYTDKGTYTGANKAALKAVEPALDPTGQKWSFVAEPTVSDTGYSFTIKSQTTNEWTIANAAGVITRTCKSVVDTGGCSAAKGSTAKW